MESKITQTQAHIGFGALVNTLLFILSLREKLPLNEVFLDNNGRLKHKITSGVGFL